MIRSRQQTLTVTPEHAPAEFGADCFGEMCPNWKGRPCSGSKFIWKGAKATVTEGRDTTLPPLRNEAVFVTYGQFCLGRRDKPKDLVAYRVDDYDNGHFYYDETGLIIHGDSRFQNLDVTVYKVGVDAEGQRVEEQTAFFDDWG